MSIPRVSSRNLVWGGGGGGGGGSTAKKKLQPMMHGIHCSAHAQEHISYSENIKYRIKIVIA